MANQLLEKTLENTFTNREVKKEPSTERTKSLKARYLRAPLVIDCEFIYHFTNKWKETEGQHILLRRALSYKEALQNKTPVIRQLELIIGDKTRFFRGAIPYVNYATEWLVREFRKDLNSDSQDRYIDLGNGGGVARALDYAKELTEGELFADKFLILAEDKKRLREVAMYWQGKCMQDVGDMLWKENFQGAQYIIDGWKTSLYTAPHDTCPEGRFILAYDLVLEYGLNGLIELMQEKIKNHQVTTPAEAEKLIFWKAGIITCEAGIIMAQNYAKKARELAETETDAQQKKDYEDIAVTLEHVPANPARTFREAVQSYWFTHVLGHLEGSHLGMSPGRADQFLYPFYKKDIETGFITKEEALELLELLRIKFTQVEYVASFSWEGLGSGNMFQHLVLGGSDVYGRAADNELSLLFLESALTMQTTQPTVGILYQDDLSSEFLLKAVDVVKTGVGFPAWFNSDIAIKHFLYRDQASLEDARDWAIGGCVEMQMQGKCYGIVQPGFINHCKLFELAFNNGKDPVTGIQMFPADNEITNYYDLVDNYKKFLTVTIKNWQLYWNYVMAAHRITVPLVFCSVLTHDCIARGMCLDDGGARYNSSPTVLSSGIINVANSLAALKKCVFEEGLFSSDEVRQALAADFEGYPHIRRALQDAPKFGNDDPYVDDIAVDLFETYCHLVPLQKNYLGKQYDPAMLSISTHTPFGKACGATPDGRKAGEPLCDAAQSAYPGTDIKGPTALIRSATRIDSTPMRSTQLNVKFHPSTLHGIEGTKKLLQFIKTYFDLGGYHIQFNVVDNNMLKDAQKHPEKYRDLIVRVAGFSAYWVELSKSLQDQVIQRTEYLAL